jgi:hypothetical protein
LSSSIFSLAGNFAKSVFVRRKSGYLCSPSFYFEALIASYYGSDILFLKILVEIIKEIVTHTQFRLLSQSSIRVQVIVGSF